MRPVHLSDLHYAATMLATVPPEQRKRLFFEALTHADIADRYRKRLRKAHPEFGLGTLTSAFSGQPIREIHPPHDVDYLQSMLVVVSGLLHRAGHNLA